MQNLYNRSPSMFESQQKLELFISCRSLANMDTFSKSDPYVIMSVQQNNQWHEYGRTERINDNLNPNFTKTFIIEYFFETRQPLKFEVFDYDGPQASDFIGRCETTLGNIAGAKDQLVVLDLKDGSKKNGTLIIRADQVRLINDKLIIQFRAEKIPETRFMFWHSTSPFLRFYRIRKDTGEQILVHETEHISNNRSPNWKQIQIQSQKLCNGDYNMPLKIELWDFHQSGNHSLVCWTEMSVQEMHQKQLKRDFKTKDKSQAGCLILQDFRLIEKPSFLDYLQGGTQLNLITAIDFTGSNGNPLQANSLHYISPNGQQNQYQAAIISVGEILMNYDHDKKVPLYGFGCKPNLPTLRSNTTLHRFPLNGNPEDPEVYGLEGIMNAYNFAVRNVSLDGPTYFNPIITESMKIAEMCRDMASDTYFVLLIITDGEIHDMKPTVNSIVAASHLPLSIIIVGVGNADFTSMEVLDDDDGKLVDDRGKRTQRDLVQFVPFNQFKNNPELLAKNVLQELPDQLVDYMLLINKKPNPKKSNCQLDLDIDLQNLNVDQVAANYGQVRQATLQQVPQQFPSQNQLPPPNGQFQQPQFQGQYQQPPPPGYVPQQQFPPQQQYPPQGYVVPPQQYSAPNIMPTQQYPMQNSFSQANIPQQQQPTRMVNNFANSNFMAQHIQQANNPYQPK